MYTTLLKNAAFFQNKLAIKNYKWLHPYLGLHQLAQGKIRFLIMITLFKCRSRNTDGKLLYYAAILTGGHKMLYIPSVSCALITRSKTESRRKLKNFDIQGERERTLKISQYLIKLWRNLMAYFLRTTRYLYPTCDHCFSHVFIPSVSTDLIFLAFRFPTGLRSLPLQSVPPGPQTNVASTPLSDRTASNSTGSPSAKLRKPSICMTVWERAQQNRSHDI